MRIKKIIGQHRRDFQAVYKCQHCGHEQQGYGYDDHHFHSEVIPNMQCKKCGKIGGEATSEPTVPAHVVI